jgi:SpoVK/Ycf46/Vps4 family AAA+-type ATPase
MLVITKTAADDLLEEESFRRAIGLDVHSARDLAGPKAVRLLKKKLAELEGQPLRREGALYSNIDRLSTEVGLTTVDKDVLAFVTLLRTQACLRECASLFDDVSILAAKDVLAEVLGLDRAEIHRVLKEESPLCSSGLMRLNRTETELYGMLDLLEGLDTTLLDDAGDCRTMFRAYFSPAASTGLTPDDFPHLREDFDLLQGMLATALSIDYTGINILFYGKTGTGKTQFARVLAASLNAPLMAISHEHEDSNLEEPHLRFRSYLLSQKVLARRANSLILFDEIEDVFSHSMPELFGCSQAGRYKAWTNEVLESNPRPALWLCNHIDQIDPAFRRRFTYVLRFRTPTHAVRRSMLLKHLGVLTVRPEWIDRITSNQALTPAVIEQACKAGELSGKEEPAALESLMERVIKNSLEVQGQCTEFKPSGHATVTRYSLEFLNPSQDLAALVEGLKQKPAGRICLYGPPGSGKTAYAQYVSEQADRPLLQKHASDLLNCFIGETEKNIADMFREAKSEKAILLLDEADSFLQDRRGAQHSWEVTQVNELLVQMESYDGLFICSTNLMDSLDQAVLRRFDLKISFGYLKQDQAWNMFVLALKEQNGNNPEPNVPESLRTRLARLTNLTPGDYATVIRQARVLGKSYDAERLLAALEEECKAKASHSKPVKGFVN